MSVEISRPSAVSRRDRLSLSESLRSRIAVAAPLLVSLLIGTLVHARVSMALPVADAHIYNVTAASLVGQHFFGPHWAIKLVADRGLYPAVVAGVYGLLGAPHPAAVGWLQALFMVPLTTYLIYVAGREALSRRAGLFSAWGFALWLPAQWYTLWLLTETLTDLLMALVLALLAAMLARKRKALALASGISLGVLSLAHPAYQVLPVILLLALAAHFLVYERKHVRLVFLVALGVFTVQVPHIVAVAEVPLPSLGQGGIGYGGGGGWGFYAGSRAETDFVPVPDDYRVSHLSAEGRLALVGRLIDRGEIHVEPHLLAIIRRNLRSPDPVRQALTDSDYYKAGAENLLDHPEKWPLKVEGNAGRLFLLPDRLQLYRDEPLAANWRTTKWPFYERDHRTTSTWFLRPWRPLSALLVVCVVSGLLFVLLRRRDRLVLFVPLVAQTVLLIAILVEWRYVIPLWSSMFVLAGLGTVGWLETQPTTSEESVGLPEGVGVEAG